MKKNLIRIATRKSPLALWQAEFVKRQLQTTNPDLNIEIIGMLTSGDKVGVASLAESGGKGLFVKELETALLENRADLAVHSMKDVPSELPRGLLITAICKREDPRDALLALQYENIEALPNGAVVGTASLRRQCQLKAMRPDLQMKNLHGNVGTRLEKLLSGEFAALVLAAAGLERLQQTKYIRQYFAPNIFVPAIGQGALGIECRADAEVIRQWIAPINDKDTEICVTAERAMNQKFGGNCRTPIAAYATLQKNQFELQGLIGMPDGHLILRSSKMGTAAAPEKLGIAVADDLFAQGAEKILRSLT